MNYHVRPAEKRDIDAISTIANQAWTHTYNGIFPGDVIEQFVSRAYSEESLSAAIIKDRSRPARYFHVATNLRKK